MRKSFREPVGLCLRDVFADAKVFGDPDVRANSCTSVACGVCPGDVFFALDEEGQAGVAEAVELGAKAVVTDQFLPVFGVSQFVVPDAAAAYAQFCQRVVGLPAGSLSACGVIGAHGKTSVVRLLTSILQSEGKRVGCLADGLQGDGASLRSVDCPGVTAPRIARWLGEAAASGCRYAVSEIKSQAALGRCYTGIKFDLLCLTNLNYDRSFDAGRTPDADRRMAESLVDQLAPFAVLVVNADDPHCVRMMAERHGVSITYGFKKPADVTGVVVAKHAGGQELLVTHEDQTVAIGLSHLGDAGAENCLAAIASAVALGMSLTHAAQGAQACRTAPGVMQSVPAGQPFPLYMDQGDSPERLRAALNAAKSTAEGKVLVVLPENASKSLFSVATALGDLVIAIGDSAPLDHEQSVRMVDDRFGGIALAIALAERGDAVLLAGASGKASCRSQEKATVEQLVELKLTHSREPISI